MSADWASEVGILPRDAAGPLSASTGRRSAGRDVAGGRATKRFAGSALRPLCWGGPRRRAPRARRRWPSSPHRLAA